MTCEIHTEVNDKLQNHDKRITKLEISDARMSEKIESLIEKIEGLMSWIKALVMMGATGLLGFFFWYIQQLGG